jgi:nicotinamidase-related amidase
MHHPEMLDRCQTCLLLIDIQDKLLPHIHDKNIIVANIRRLVKAAEVLGLPVIVSEQYSKGLGPTVAELSEILDAEVEKYDKITFSCIADEHLIRAIADTERDTLLICGTEAHVCVSQTVLDALTEGFKVQVAADAVGSRNPENKRLALERLARAGAVVTSTEAALFELLERAGTEEFKKVQALVK